MFARFVKSTAKQVTGLLVTCFIQLALMTSAIGHTYFFGVSDLIVNDKTQHFEIIHQFTAHDIENAIAEIKQIHFSPEHEKYDLYVQEYIEQGFSLKQNGIVIKLTWLGFEVKSGKIIAFQESSPNDKQESFLAELVVKNTILVDTYPRQVNTVNFQGKDKQGKALYGSLTFDNRIKVVEIAADKEQTLKVNQEQ